HPSEEKALRWIDDEILIPRIVNHLE
ncbi:MAG: hypothetical protein RLZZ519_2098, partial [Bacteroidota bacterium]